MNAHGDAFETPVMKFGIGQPVTRKEDPSLVQGRGAYSDDFQAPGQSYATFARSPHAHARIRGIDIAEARSAPGVLGVYTIADLTAAGLRGVPPGVMTANRDGTPMRWPTWPALAQDRVRHVGEPIALVVAETATQARDAAELVRLDAETLPVVTRASLACEPGAPAVDPEFPGNVVLDFHSGDAEKVALAFAGAHRVVTLDIISNRVVVNPMEPRASVGEYDPETGRYTGRFATQGAFGARGMVAHVLNVPLEKVRVLTGDVGGSFGMKAHPLAEDYCVLFAAKALGRPVKWTDTRSDSFVSDTHGRDHEMKIGLALDVEGHFLAMRLSGFGNFGAYICQGGIFTPAINQMKNSPSVYRTPLIEIAVKCVLTNTTPVGAYRGNGRPEANYYVERVIDAAAAEMAIDPADLRRRNHIRPGDLPYRAPSGLTYDSGDFSAVLDRAIELSDWAGYPARLAASQAAGKLRGRGIGQYLEVTGAPSPEMGAIRFDADGGLTVVTGTLDSGQGHGSAFAQVVVSTLGVPFERVRLIQGDSDQLVAGGGTGGSKSITTSGKAIVEAGAKVIAIGRKIAGHLLETAEADIEFHQGRFTVAGTDRSVGLLEMAAILRDGVHLPTDVPRSLNVSHTHKGAESTFPNGCHIVELEIDQETGVVEIERYTSVNDFGVLINPRLVEGQAHGGIVQGIGQALMEHAVYDDDGQLVTGSYMDYALPRASDAPALSFSSLPAPALTNPLGVKGCGEAGCAGALPAVMNAVVNALGPLGVKHIDMPATPQLIWRLIQENKVG